MSVAAMASLLATAMPSASEARGHRHHGGSAHRHAHVGHKTRHAARAAIGHYSPLFAAMVVDANTGRTLFSENEDGLRHPASISKVMTLYLLFEQLEKGRLTLSSEIGVSAHAAAMEPSKLGIPAGGTITIENAIRAIVTLSANDMAVAVAEAIGGDESHFAEMMTAKARALGMSRTHYANASGLPNPNQITTARDLTVLGRSINDRFPKYYAYFSTPVFRYGARRVANHNHLLGRIDGMDGIKTGYVRASGFNLLASVRRGGRHIVAVVLGGTSGPARDRIMAGLIEEHIAEASPVRSSRFAELDSNGDDAVQASAYAETPKAAVIPDLPTPKPLAVAAVEKPRPAVIAAVAAADPMTTGSIPERRTMSDGSTNSRSLGGATPSATGSATPSTLRWVAGPAPAAPPTRSVKPIAAALAAPPAKSEPSPRQQAERQTPISEKRPARGGMMIQIGATDDAGKATDLLSRARSHAALGAATPFTERVQKGSRNPVPRTFRRA